MTILDVFLIPKCPKCGFYYDMRTVNLLENVFSGRIIHTMYYCPNSLCRYAFIKQS